MSNPGREPPAVPPAPARPAYRMLGSMTDAKDAVQETYLRWCGRPRQSVGPGAFVMTATTGICLDMLTPTRARREEYVGPAENLSIALLLILGRPFLLR